MDMYVHARRVAFGMTLLELLIVIAILGLFDFAGHSCSLDADGACVCATGVSRSTKSVSFIVFSRLLEWRSDRGSGIWNSTGVAGDGYVARQGIQVYFL